MFSRWTAWQTFSIDQTRPDVPTVSSAEYPEDQWGAELGTEGTFSFSSNAADVVEFLYHFDYDYGRVEATGTGPRVASVRYTPPSSMSHLLAVTAIDPAGNTSDPRHYRFLVTSPPERYSNWTLDGTTIDSGNIGADGILSGDVSFGPGKLADAAVFNGGTISTAASVVDTADSFTVMAWVNPRDLSGSQTIAAQGALRLYLDATTNAWCGSLGTTVACANGQSWGPPTVDQWVHLALRFDAIRGTLTIFVMGDWESCWLPSERTEVGAAAVASVGPLVIGDRWHGAIDEVWAYRRALEGVEICMAADK
ncbi:LamG domain-containing protein [Allorhizocola rhizosphaerae]|uniref:LamG domain-containing protein n=1 Tax=Allorhizocola rhizosphaerae TaxID=1872709 RepID=UPI001B8CFB99|nr:LamG domain-containing protein [Allorhizocola rhizosphaerae]